MGSFSLRSCIVVFQSGRERDTGARITTAHEGQSRAADHKPLTSALRYVSHSRPPHTIPQEATTSKPPLTYSVQESPRVGRLRPARPVGPQVGDGLTH